MMQTAFCWWFPACPVLQDGDPLLCHQGEGQAGAAGPQEDVLHCCAFTEVNPEDKGAQAKQLEAIRTSSKNRYNAIPCHWGGNILVPQSVTPRKGKGQRTNH